MSTPTRFYGTVFCTFLVMTSFAVLVMTSFAANAFDLSGAWATDAASCGKVFIKRHN
jgi:hypothetical protein